MARLLLRHPRHVALAGLVIGLLLGANPALAVVVGAIGCATIARITRRALLALSLGIAVALGSSIGSARLAAIDRSDLRSFAGHYLVLRGFVVKRERPTLAAQRARVRVTAVKAGSAWRAVGELAELRVPISVRFKPPLVGGEVEVEGALKEPPSGTRDGFDYGAYLRRAGIHVVVSAGGARATGRRRAGLAGLIDTLRSDAESGVSAGLEPRLGALARGMVLGEDEQISSAMSDDFKRSGLAHVLAVSGQNVTLLSMLAFPLLGVLGLGRRARLIAVLVLIALYVPLTGASPSIVRAGAMGGAATVAALAGRPQSRWYALLLAAAVGLVIDPRAWQDVGWQLSFAAVVGIFCLVGPLMHAFRRLPEPLDAAAALTVAATIATAPLMSFHFGRVSAVSLLANLVALPAIAPVMWLGMIDSALAQVAIAPAAIVNAVNVWCLAYVAAVAHWASALPGAVWTLRIPSVGALVVVYVGIAAAAAIALRVEARGSVWRRRAIMAPAVALALAALGWVAASGGARSPDSFTITFMDVGQGDATLLQAPFGPNVLVDGGPVGDGLVSKLRAAGVRSLDLVVLTHPQADHEDGLEPVLRDLPVRMLLDGGGGSATPEHRRIVALAHDRHVQVVRGETGEALNLGELRLRVLSPEGGFDAGAQVDPNQQAIVLLASFRGLDVLLPADAESDVTGQLSLRPVEVLKVAHHGSEDGGLPELLERLHPQIAVIEVGADNPYGHPRPSTIAALRSRVARLYRTDRDGNVRIALGQTGLEVSTQH